VLVSAIHQHESATGIHMSPPSWTSLSPLTLSYSSRLSQSTGFEFPVSYRKFPLAIYLTYGNVYFNATLSICPTLSIPHCVHKSVFSVCIFIAAAAAAAKLRQLCPTLCDPIDGSPPGSTVPGILQARTLEWVAISFSNAWKWKVKVKPLSRARLFTTSLPSPCQLLGLDKHFPLHLLLLVAEKVQESRLFGSTPNSFGATSEGPSLLLGQPLITCNSLPPSLASKSSKPFQLLELSSTFQICLCLLLDCGGQAILLELCPLPSPPPCSLLHLRGENLSLPLHPLGCLWRKMGKYGHWKLTTLDLNSSSGIK